MKNRFCRQTLPILFALACACPVPASAETVTLQWVKRYNGPGSKSDYGYAIAADASGNTFVTGGSISSSAVIQMYSAKYAADGHLLWERRREEYGVGVFIQVNAAGDVIVAGLRAPGPSSEEHVYLAKYAGNDGAVIWEKIYQAGLQEQLVGLALDPNGDPVFVAASTSRIEFPGYRRNIYDYYTAKYAGSDGHLLWEQRYNAAFDGIDLPTGFGLDSGGNAIVVGESERSSTKTVGHAIKYAAVDGHVLWEKDQEIGGGGYATSPKCLAIDPAGNFAVAGDKKDLASSDPLYYAAKYSGVDGSAVFTLHPGFVTSGIPPSVAFDAFGDLFVSMNKYVPNAASKNYLSKYSGNTGALLWQKTPAQRISGPPHLLFDSYGNLILTASSYSNSDVSRIYTAKYLGDDGEPVWEQLYEGISKGDDIAGYTVPSALGGDGSVNVVGFGDTGNPLDGNYYDMVTLKYVVSGTPPGVRFLWNAGLDLLRNEKPDNATEGNATNTKVPEWSYGYRFAGASTALTLFTPQQHTNDASGLEGWIAPGQATLGVNTTDHAITFNTGSGNYKPLLAGQIYLSPGSGNEFLVARWTAPETGDYRVFAKWVDLDNHGGNGANAQLIKNGELHFNCTDGRPCSFAEIFQSTQTKLGRARLRARTLHFTAGEPLDFVFGSQGENTFDATAFNATIRRVPTVTITSPASGSELTGDITFTVDVHHSTDIRDVFLFFDGQSTGIGGNPNNPYSIRAAPRPGYHKVVAIVTDTDGVEVESPEITFIVKEPAALESTTNKPSGAQQAGGLHKLCRTIQSGNWNDSRTWLNGFTPQEFDDVIIETGHQVVTDFAQSPRDLIVNGTLSQSGLDVKRMCFVNGTVDHSELNISTGGKLIVGRTGAAIRFSTVNNYGRTNITATDFDAEGSTFKNLGTLKVKTPIGSQGPLAVAMSEFEQRGQAGNTALGANTRLQAPAGTRILGGVVDLAPAYFPLIGNDGNTLIGNDGNTLIGNDGNSLIGNDGNSLISNRGAGVISEDGLGLLSDGGGGLIGDYGSGLVGPDGFPLVGNDGASLIGNDGNTINQAGSGRGASSPPILLGGGTTITGTGEIVGDVINQGAFIAPGHSAGGLVVMGNYTQEAGGTLVVELGGNTFLDSFSYDIFQVAGTANLGGNLVVKTINNYTPASGEMLPAIFYTNHTGNFQSITSNAQITVGTKGARVTTDGTNPPAPRALNISTRLQIQGGDNVLIAGFIVTGPAGSTKKVLIRGIGPSLAQFGVPGTIPDPLLELHTSDTTITNDNWQQAPNASEIPNSFVPTDPKESIIIATLPPGNYTAILNGAHGETGVGLAEVYDLEPNSGAQLANIATRGFVQTGDNVLIAGFIVSGNEPARMLVRAIGPSLSAFLPGALQDTTLELHDSNGGAISNDDWLENQAAEIFTTTLQPYHDKEAAILATLGPGSYTAIVRGQDGTTGIAVVEAYNLQ
jgi:hypothetical protein